MKNLIFFMLLGFNQCYLQQVEKHTNPELDQIMVNFLYSNTIADNLLLDNSMALAYHNWKENASAIQNIERRQTIDKFIGKLALAVENRDLLQIKSNSKNILDCYKDLRSKNNIDDYPIDILLEMHTKSKELEFVVYDQMFDLKYWFEFKDILNDYSTSWNKYQELDIDAIQMHFPKISDTDHQEIVDKVDDCSRAFLESLESGYQPDFQLPCNEMTNSIESLIALYKIKLHHLEN